MITYDGAVKVIDFGIANTKSILKTIIQLGSEATISNDIKILIQFICLNSRVG